MLSASMASLSPAQLWNWTSITSQRAALRTASIGSQNVPQSASLESTVEGLKRSNQILADWISLVPLEELKSPLENHRSLWKEPSSYICAKTFDETKAKIANETEPKQLRTSVFFRNSGLFSPRNQISNQQIRTLMMNTRDRGRPFQGGSRGKNEPELKLKSAVEADSAKKKELDELLEMMKRNKDNEDIHKMGLTTAHALGHSEGSAKDDTKLSGLKRLKYIFYAATGIGCLFLVARLLGVNVSVVSGGSGQFEVAEDVDVVFDDVKGCDEAKEELLDIVDYLRNPEKYTALGGELPKGCLLVGPPGTGKTLLARAVAGEAGVPFFYASGSEFDEVFVGMGASRIRKLFKQAKERAPAVIFIDEIDSVGGKRTASGLHPHANQTINQLLSEMDGFSGNTGVIVLGATNFKDILDKALLRPGRFDTEVMVVKPDRKGRKDLIELYLSKVMIDNTIEVEDLAKLTNGFSGADIKNLINSAAVKAARENKAAVSMDDIAESLDKKKMGTQWKSRKRREDDIKLTAYHEAGHTLVAYYSGKFKNKIHKVTITARGGSGGHTAFIPENEEGMDSKSELLAQLDVCMGGRLGEEICVGKENITGGAGSDFQNATQIAKLMIEKWAMSDKIGIRFYDEESKKDLSEETQKAIDAEMNKILNESYARASSLLYSKRKEMDALAAALIKYETLDSEDVELVIKGDIEGLDKKISEAEAAKKQRKNSEQIIPQLRGLPQLPTQGHWPPHGAHPNLPR